jgi:hypothetical protein
MVRKVKTPGPVPPFPIDAVLLSCPVDFFPSRPFHVGQAICRSAFWMFARPTCSLLPLNRFPLLEVDRRQTRRRAQLHGSTAPVCLPCRFFGFLHSTTSLAWPALPTCLLPIDSATVVAVESWLSASLPPISRSLKDPDQALRLRDQGHGNVSSSVSQHACRLSSIGCCCSLTWPIDSAGSLQTWSPLTSPSPRVSQPPRRASPSTHPYWSFLTIQDMAGPARWGLPTRSSRLRLPSLQQR